MASQDWLTKDFYAVLGVPKDADDATIKKTYRKLARKLHPDQNTDDPKAAERFKEVGEAYAVLSDPEQRKQYDQVRAMTSGGARFTAGPGGAGGFEDIFSGMFGGGAGPNVRFSPRGGQAPPELQDLLGGLFGGAGGGYAGQPEAGVDGGQVTTKIPAGVKDGQKIRLRGKGQPAPPGGEPGDLILAVSVAPHPVFGRDGDHLTVDLPVTFAEAALGATVSVPTLDGKKVRVKVAPGTPSGRVLRVKGRGVKTAKTTGDLLAKVQIVVPQRLTDEARAAVEALRALDQSAGRDPRAELMARAAQ